MTKRFLLTGTAFATFVLMGSPAYALSNRAWVSGHGSDSPGCGAPTLPCRSFQYVVDNVIAPGGEIDVLDPAGFGAVTVPFALSIVNDGVGEAGVQAVSGNAITITAGATDVVNLRGLTLAGNGAAFDGILFNTGSRLNVQNCVVRGFTNIGIAAVPQGDSQFHFSDTIVSDSGSGVVIQPSASSYTDVRVILSRVQSLGNNTYGFYFDGASGISGSGPSQHYGLFVNADGSSAADNGSDGFRIESDGGMFTVVMLNNSQSALNGRTSIAQGIAAGVAAYGDNVLVEISGTTFFGNLNLFQVTNGAQIISFGNNTTGENFGAGGPAFPTKAPLE